MGGGEATCESTEIFVVDEVTPNGNFALNCWKIVMRTSIVRLQWKVSMRFTICNSQIKLWLKDKMSCECSKGIRLESSGLFDIVRYSIILKINSESVTLGGTSLYI